MLLDARPAANVNACCSAIPTSKNLFGYFLAKFVKPDPSAIAGVMAHNCLFFLPASRSQLEKTSV